MQKCLLQIVSRHQGHYGIVLCSCPGRKGTKSCIWVGKELLNFQLSCPTYVTEKEILHLLYTECTTLPNSIQQRLS